jgi:hypothetical protein
MRGSYFWLDTARLCTRPYVELGTLRAWVVCMGMDNVVILSLYQTMTCKQRFEEIEPGSTPFILSPSGK